ncbi:MAG: VOC family protein [Pseudomonadota bacterium]
MEDHSKHGIFSWNELLTTDVQAARDFYTKLFGWEAEVVPSEMGDYIIFKVGEEQVGGLAELPPQAREMGAPPYWGAYVSVDDVDAVTAKVEEMGGRVLVPPMDIKGVGRFATYQDPQGAVISAITSKME